MLSPKEVIEQTKLMLEWRDKDAYRLNRLYKYAHGKQQFLWLPKDAPNEVKKIAEMSRVNVLGLVVNSVAQSMYVDGYRAPRQETEDPAWKIWQKNKLDARQIGVHRAALTYGLAYTTVLPGDNGPVLRGLSPRDLTTVYGEDDDWPVYALERRRSPDPSKRLYRLFDDEQVYWVSVTVDRQPMVATYWTQYLPNETVRQIEFVSSEVHDAGRVPVVRFLAKSDLDEEVGSDLEDLIPLQDQINLTTFALLVVQHFGAFPQKWITGWMAETEEEQVEIAVNKVLTFEDTETKLGQFEAAGLDGYIESRRDSLRNLATISQTPAHALRGELVNLSAEALAAAEQGERRKVTEYETMFGESWEQTLGLAGEEAGQEADPAAEVRWKDTEARAFAATVDALGKLAQMLGIPVEELWERVPGVTQQEIERWKATAAKGDALGRLENYLVRSANALAGAETGAGGAAAPTS